ncbi:MAG: hypothetical protein L0G94_10510 [Brachybacterium sp.]|uniref:hypothetical protein n=1 Tax=Brachybacterium sp. TaxID=1891286 RepID=UPI0026485C5D|nr:hypothetical protein [Brachybacterium sp.]MDN5687087.1 hypothetical protein [Brachybacterium sp.]
MNAGTPWGKVYGDLWRHEKWVGLSKGGKALWTSAFSWSKESKTYGRIPGHLLFIFDGLPEEADELVSTGLWIREDGDYVFHDWDERQESLAKDRDVSEKRAEAGRKSGRKRRSQREAGTNGNKGRTSAEQARTNTPDSTRQDAPITAGDDAPEVLFPLVQDESRNKPELEREREREFSTTRSSGGPASRAFVYPDGFELWWKAYPRKDDKRKALTSWKTATRSVDNADLIAGAERYRDDPNRSEAYTKLPTTWLNGHCWENGPLPPRGGPSGRPQAGDTHRAMERSHTAAQKYRALEDAGYYDQTPQITPINARRTA